MVVQVFEIRVTVDMQMPRTVVMFVFVLVKNNLEPAIESLGDPTERRKARHMVAALESRDHRLGHSDSRGELLLGLSTART